MNILKGIFLALFFLAGIVIGNSPMLLDLVPVWVIIALWCSLWMWVAMRYRNCGKSERSVQSMVKVKGQRTFADAGVPLCPEATETEEA